MGKRLLLTHQLIFFFRENYGLLLYSSKSIAAFLDPETYLPHSPSHDRKGVCSKSDALFGITYAAQIYVRSSNGID